MQYLKPWLFQRDKAKMFAEGRRFSHTDLSHAAPVAFRDRKQAFIHLMH